MIDLIKGTAVGSIAGETHGWIVGHFCKGPAHSQGLEVKTWRYDEQPHYPVKFFPGTELIMVEGGALTIVIEGQKDTVLYGKYRDWLILPKNTPKRVVVHESPVWGVTVRWPSTP